MRITEVRVRLIPNGENRLKAFCSMTLDHEFVVRDIKIVEGTGGYFVAMPSRKMCDHCQTCGGKNHLKAKYCNGCGKPLPPNRTKRNPAGEAVLHADIAHPINAECRRRIHEQLVAAYEQEVKKSKEPGYRPPELDESDDDAVGSPQ